MGAARGAEPGRLGRALAQSLATDYQPSDESGLECERNVTALRPRANGTAGGRRRRYHEMSSALRPPPPQRHRAPWSRLPSQPDAALAESLAASGLVVAVETDDEWTARITKQTWSRVRILGTVPPEARAASVTLFADPVTASGRLELFPFLREQAISMTAHRFGTPTPLAQAVDLAASRSAS